MFIGGAALRQPNLHLYVLTLSLQQCHFLAIARMKAQHKRCPKYTRGLLGFRPQVCIVMLIETERRKQTRKDYAFGNAPGRLKSLQTHGFQLIIPFTSGWTLGLININCQPASFNILLSLSQFPSYEFLQFEINFLW